VDRYGCLVLSVGSADGSKEGDGLHVHAERFILARSSSARRVKTKERRRENAGTSATWTGRTADWQCVLSFSYDCV